MNCEEKIVPGRQEDFKSHLRLEGGEALAVL